MELVTAASIVASIILGLLAYFRGKYKDRTDTHSVLIKDALDLHKIIVDDLKTATIRADDQEKKMMDLTHNVSQLHLENLELKAETARLRATIVELNKTIEHLRKELARFIPNDMS